MTSCKSIKGIKYVDILALNLLSFSAEAHQNKNLANQRDIMRIIYFSLKIPVAYS